MNGRDALDRARSKTLGKSESGSAFASAIGVDYSVSASAAGTAGPNGQQQQQLAPAAVSTYVTQENVNLEETKKYIKILEDKIQEYMKSLVDIQVQRQTQTSQAIEELNKCAHDTAKQDHTKRRLQREQGEFATRTQSIQSNIQKLEYKLKELRAHGIPKQVVPDDYVRQLKNKDKKRKVGLLGVPNLIKGKTASSGDLLGGGGGGGASSVGGGSIGVGIEALGPYAASTAGRSTATGSPQKKAQSLEHDTVPPPPLHQQHLQQPYYPPSTGVLDSDRLTVSSSEPPGTGKKTSLSDEDGSRSKLPVAFGLGGGGGGPRSTLGRGNYPASRQSSKSSGSARDSSAQLPNVREEAAVPAAAPEPVLCDPTETLRAHFDHQLEDQRRTLSADLETVRSRLQEETSDIHHLVHTEIHKLRYDQQELSASLDDNQKELEKMKVFLTNLSKEVGKLMLVDQQIDDINNKVTMLSRDLQGGAVCPHGRPDSAATTSTRMLNLLVALLSYGFVAVSCLINLFMWLFGLLRSRPFVIVCLAVLLLALLLRQWPVLPPLTSDSLATALARNCPHFVRRFLADLALALNKTSSAADSSVS